MSAIVNYPARIAALVLRPARRGVPIPAARATGLIRQIDPRSNQTARIARGLPGTWRGQLTANNPESNRVLFKPRSPACKIRSWQRDHADLAAIIRLARLRGASVGMVTRDM
jgi:hypothetical protein